MDGRRLLWIAVLVGVGYYVYTHFSKSAPTPAGSSTRQSGSQGAPSSTNGVDCVRAAQSANGGLHDAAMLLARMPVDQAAWSEAESRESSLISSAESACSGGNSENERNAMAEARTALGLMRTSLSDFSTGARGGGGTTEVTRRQGEIDEHLDKARALTR